MNSSAFEEYVGYEPVDADKIRTQSVDIPALVVEGERFLKEVVPAMAKEAGITLLEVPPKFSFSAEGNGGIPHRVCATDDPDVTWVFVPRLLSTEDSRSFAGEVMPGDTGIMVVAAAGWQDFPAFRTALQTSWKGDLVFLLARHDTFGLRFELSV